MPILVFWIVMSRGLAGGKNLQSYTQPLLRRTHSIISSKVVKTNIMQEAKYIFLYFLETNLKLSNPETV
jgi:hypothetical protein